MEGIPDIPPVLVTLSLDPVSHNVHLDQDSLQKSLVQLRNYVKDTTTKGFRVLQAEIDNQVSEAKRELQLTLQEGTLELEDRLASKGLVQELEANLNEAIERLGQSIDEKLDKISKSGFPAGAGGAHARGSEIDSTILAGDEGATSRELNFGGGEDGDEEREFPQGDGENDVPAESSQAVSKPPASRGTVVGGSSKIAGADLSNFIAVDDMVALEERIKQTQDLQKSELSDLKNKLQLLDGRLDMDIAAIESRCDKFDEFLKVQLRKFDAQDKRISPLEAEASRLTSEMKKLCEELQRMSRVKSDASVVDTLQAEVRRISGLVEQAAVAASLEGRLEVVEQKVRFSAEDALLAKDERHGLKQGLSDMGLRMTKCVEQITETGRKADTQLEIRCHSLSVQDRVLAENHSALEARVGSLTNETDKLSGKADMDEVAALRGALSGLAEDIKDKEQAVLFGARCLSCNRVFDDVETHAGTVNVRAEKQRAQIYSDIQRALHSPRSDPRHPIKMIAVKVGRPSHLTGNRGLGPFEGRDASSLAWGAEDVELIQARGITPTVGPSSAGRPATTASSSGRRIINTTASTWRPATTPSGAAGAANAMNNVGVPGSPGNESSPPTTLAELRGNKKDATMDFKHPLGELVGRAGGKSVGVT